MSSSAELLRSIGLCASTEAIAALVSHATTSRQSITEFVDALILLERRERDERNLSKRMKSATLGTFAPIDRFDWTHPRHIDRGHCDELFDLEFIRKGHNVLLRGPSGVGKTMVAQNLGLRAVENGFTVKFCSLASALADLLRQESVPAVERRLRQYTRPHLLVLDEIGYLPQDSRSADLLYNIITRRHEQRSTIVTTNLSFKQWNSVFPGAACVGALVDRFTQHCHVLDIDADSYRQKKQQKTVSTITDTLSVEPPRKKKPPSDESTTVTRPRKLKRRAT